MCKEGNKLNVAVIGAGISGLGAAWLLSKKHNVTVFESDNHFGGHANTVTAITPDGDIAVDTGFIVCNDRNYPNFLALMNKIGITPYPTEMSFGVSMDNGGFEYAGSPKLTSLAAQPLNLLRPRFWKMVSSILRFYEETNKIDPKKAAEITLRDYLNQENYDDGFMRDHILPMAAAVWSTPSNKVGDFPLTSFLRFCQNHGLLQVKDRPQWYTIPGGSKTYVKALMNNSDAIYYNNAPITNIIRKTGGVSIKAHGKKEEIFDRILIATHANTALKMINDANSIEKAILGSFKYAKNRAILHSDERFMPKRKRAWSSWNYMQSDSDNDRNLSVTYWMNLLQPLKTDTNLFVTLNPEEEPRADLIHYSKDYEHPIFDLSTLQAQKRMNELMGYRNIWYAGAHFGYGFHEDGLQSGLYAAENLGNIKRPWSLPDMNSRILTAEYNKIPNAQSKNHNQSKEVA